MPRALHARAVHAAGYAIPGAPWHRLYFFPDPHGHGALRDGPAVPTAWPGAGIFAPAVIADCGPLRPPRPSAGACSTLTPPVLSPSSVGDEYESPRCMFDWRIPLVWISTGLGCGSSFAAIGSITGASGSGSG